MPLTLEEIAELLRQPAPLQLANRDLWGVQLTGASLRGANLRAANLNDSKLFRVESVRRQPHRRQTARGATERLGADDADDYARRPALCAAPSRRRRRPF